MRPNLPIAFASVLLSVMLWFVVYVQNVPESKPINAPLTLDGFNDARFFLPKEPADVRLVVNAPAERAKDLSEERVTASVDLSSPQPGLHAYPVAVSPDWVRRYLDDPHPTVRIEVQPMDDRVVRVTSVVKGALRDPNLQITSRKIAPTTVTVRGPAPEVATVREVRAYLDLSAIDPLRPESQDSEPIPLDARGGRPEHVRTNPSTVENTYKLSATPSTKPALVYPDLDVTYDSSALPGGFRVEPKNVTISGKPAILANVSTIRTETLRVRGLGRERTFRVRLIPPDGTTIVGKSEVSVTLLVRPAPPPVVDAPPPHPTPVTSPTR